MEQPSYMKIAALAETPEAIANSISYLQQKMSRFLKKKEKVLILFQNNHDSSSRILEESVLACECTPIWIGPDRRWMTMLKTAFTSKCNCIIGSPLMLLGLSKLARYMGTPLFARNVMMAGYPTSEWLVNGVRKGLDCMAWGCFDPGIGAVVAGFTCEQVDGVHVRAEEYSLDIVDDEGRSLPPGEMGHVILYPNADPTLRFAVGDRARLSMGKCACGSCEPKLVDIDTVKPEGVDLAAMGESLHYWSSILDCRLEKTECGLELELIVFQGEKLPKLPTAARLIVRAFNPEKDEPFPHHEVLNRRYLSQ